MTMAPGDVPEWDDWSGAEINIFSAWGWNNLIQPVHGFDAESRTIRFDSYNDVRPGNRYFISGVRGCLTDPGEWHRTAASGTIRYLAPPGAEASTAPWRRCSRRPCASPAATSSCGTW